MGQMAGDMIAIQIAKADPSSVVPLIPDVTIEIAGNHPELSRNESRDFYHAEAKRLFDAMKSSLPGGTLDALLMEMLRNRACLLRVPLYDEKP